MGDTTVDKTVDNDSDMEVSFNVSKSTLDTPNSASTPKKKPGRKAKGNASKKSDTSEAAETKGDMTDKSSTETHNSSKTEEKGDTKDKSVTEEPRSSRSRRSASRNELKDISISVKVKQSIEDIVPSETEEDSKDVKTNKGSKKGRLKGKSGPVVSENEIKVELPIDAGESQESKPTASNKEPMKRRSIRNSSVAIEQAEESDIEEKPRDTKEEQESIAVENVVTPKGKPGRKPKHKSDEPEKEKLSIATDKLDSALSEVEESVSKNKKGVKRGKLKGKSINENQIDHSKEIIEDKSGEAVESTETEESTEALINMKNKPGRKSKLKIEKEELEDAVVENVEEKLLDTTEQLKPTITVVNPHIEKIMFGYFFWVTVNEKDHANEAVKSFCEAGYQSVAYCHECIISTDVALNKHKDKCKNEDDLNKLCKVIVSDTPKFDDPEKVLLVYSPSLVLLRDVDHLKSISQHSVLFTFSKFCFIECSSMLNSLNLYKSLHDHDKSDFGPLKCYKVNSSFNYQTYSARSPHKAKVSKERETMRKTLDLYELQKGDHNKALLLLGQAVKSGNKSKSSSYRFLIWVQRLLGPDCLKVVSGTELDLEIRQKSANEKGTIDVDHNGEKLNPSKRGPSSDYTVYNVAFFKSGAAATAAYRRCNLVYMFGSHLNIVQMISFMHSPLKSHRKGASRIKSLALQSDLLKSPSKVESSQLPVSAFLPGAKFEPGASAFSGSEDEIPFSDSDLEPPKKKVFTPSKLASASTDVFDSLFPAGGSDTKLLTEPVQSPVKSGPSPTITFLPKNGLISCLFCRKEKDSTCKELKKVCKENKDGLIQQLCGEQMNFNPEDFVICKPCYETLPVIEVFTNREATRLMTAWDYMDVAKKVKAVMGDLIHVKLKDKDKEHIKLVKGMETNAKKKLEQKIWDKDQDLEELREQAKAHKNDTKLEKAESRIEELEKDLKSHEDQLLEVNTDKSKLEKKLEEVEKANVGTTCKKEELSKQIIELTIKVEALDKDSIKSVVREEMLKDEITTKDSDIASKDVLIEELNLKVKSLEEETKNAQKKKSETDEEQLSVAQEELDNLRTELSNMKAELEVKEKAVSSKETRAEEFQDKWRETEAKLAKRNNDVTKLGETISKHAAEMKESQAKHVSEIKDCKSKHLEEIDALEHKLHNISQTVNFKEECLQLLRDKRIDTSFHEVKVDVSKISQK